MQTVDVGPWIGTLMVIVGLAMTVAMAKWVVHREKKRGEIKAKSKV
jgi:hypothetical protein